MEKKWSAETPDEEKDVDDWRTMSKIIFNPKTGFEELVLLPGAKLYRANNLFASHINPPPGFYGTFDTAFLYLTKLFDSGKISEYIVQEPIVLLNISYKNLEHLVKYETEVGASNVEELKYLNDFLLNNFSYEPRSSPTKFWVQYHLRKNQIEGAAKDEELFRNSSYASDFQFSDYLCERGYQGYGYKTLDRSLMHSEVMLCSGNKLKISPIEWRINESDLNHLVIWNFVTKEEIGLHPIEVSSTFGGTAPGIFPDDEADPFLTKEHTKSSVKDLWKMSFDKRRELGNRLDIKESKVESKSPENFAFLSVPDLLSYGSKLGESIDDKKEWNRLTDNALVHFRLPPHHATVPNLKRAFANFVNEAKVANQLIPRHDHVLRVMSWNIHLYEVYNINYPTEKDFERVKVILDYSPDIICLQEVATRSLHWLNSILIPFGYHSSSCVAEKRGLTNTTFYRVPPIQIIESKQLKLVQNSITQESRCINMQRIYLPMSDLYFWIFNTHLDVYDYTKSTRWRQIHDILNLINRVTEPTDMVLISGDFNSTIDSALGEKAAVHQEWLKSRKTGFHPLDIETLSVLTSAGFSDLSQVSGTQIPVSVWSGSRVDFIFGKNIPRTFIGGVYAVYTDASDHLPIIADIKLPGPVKRRFVETSNVASKRSRKE